MELIKRRRVRRLAQHRSFSQRALHVGALVLGVAGLAAALIALTALPAFAYITQNLPPIERLEELLDPQTGELLQPTRFYDRAGEQLLLSLEPAGAPRTFVDIPGDSYLALAFVASNQPDFWQAKESLLSDLLIGPRTIAERLVANLLLDGEPDGWAKTLRARLLAADAVGRYGRAQVLSWALNSAYFGYWAFGAESAAQLFFGKSAAELSLAEAALLAAVAQAPALNPIDAPELAVEYQLLVLASMHSQGLINADELAAALAEQLTFSTPTEAVSLVPDFTDLALTQLEAELGREGVQRGGLEVVTTLDYALQQEVAALIAESGDEAEVVVLDAINNRVLAAIGSVDEASHNSGTLFSPFIYLNAFANGISPAQVAWDVGPRDIGFNEPMTFRQALATQYGRVESEILINPIIAPHSAELLLAAGFGAFDSADSNAESLRLVLGTQVSALEAATAYGLFSQNGLLIDASPLDDFAISSITFAADTDGVVLLDLTHPEPVPISSPELAYLVTDVLSDVSVRADRTGQAMSALSRPAGFSPDDQENQWMIGYSPQRVVVLWTEQGGELDNAPLAVSLFEAAHRGLPVKSWEVPAGLTSLIVCVPSGQLPDDDCPATRRELFIRGSEPTERDTLFERLAINSLNGTLATVFTPEEFVEERVFMMVPPEAETLALAAGIDLPPEDFDAVPVLDLLSAPVAVLQPAPFTAVSGMVDIIGKLGEGAVSYDIQVGQGLRPSEWLLLTEGSAEDVSSELAHWDTSGLSGVWAIQLQVWDEDGNLQRAYTIVTIK